MEPLTLKQKRTAETAALRAFRKLLRLKEVKDLLKDVVLAQYVEEMSRSCWNEDRDNILLLTKDGLRERQTDYEWREWGDWGKGGSGFISQGLSRPKPIKSLAAIRKYNLAASDLEEWIKKLQS